MYLVLVIVILAGLFVLDVPIFAILIAISLAIVYGVAGSIDWQSIPQFIFGGLDHYSLLAVPFFIFAGDIMGAGGISARIILWLDSMIGRLRGGLAYTTVAAAEFFGAISGSSTATVAAVGGMMYPELIKRGHGKRFSLGLVTSSGAIAVIIPPSITMILYGASSGQSIVKLFAAGIVPGLLIGALIMVFIYFRNFGESSETAGAAASLREILSRTYHGAWAIGTPAIILGGIYSGVFTPTESGAVACIYGLLVSRFVYRELTWSLFWNTAKQSTILSSKLMIIVACSGLLSWALTLSGAADALVSLVSSHGYSQFTVLLLINALLLVVGCLVDPVAAIVVLTPLLAPLASSVGVDLIHFGIIVVVNLSIGMFTPPFGMNIFTSQALFNVDIKEVYVSTFPFIIINIIGLLLITYVPVITMGPLAMMF